MLETPAWLGAGVLHECCKLSLYDEFNADGITHLVGEAGDGRVLAGGAGGALLVALGRVGARGAQLAFQ